MTKQVIVIRTEYNKPDGLEFGLRRGKQIAQACHASMAFLTKRIREQLDHPRKGSASDVLDLSKQEIEWIKNSFVKITVRVNSEEELMEVKQKAEEEGLVCELIVDNGKTEFGGVPTPTCLAIGPDDSEKIDKVTGDLELY